MINCPFFILHYKKNTERKNYLDRSFAATSIRPVFIEEMDREEFSFDDVFRFDEDEYARIIMYIKENIVGTAWGLSNPSMQAMPWAHCVQLALQKTPSKEETFRIAPYLRPHPPNAGEVSLILKHRIAYERIMEGGFEYAIIAEDDLLLNPKFEAYLEELIRLLPGDFDYIDLAGGLRLSPRAGNRLVNGYFYEIDPPRPRTTCCAIVRRGLIERYLRINPPFVGGIDWMLIYVFKLLRAKVYWVEPLVFGHGSQEGAYQSNLMS
jgi:hypothetical protein